MATRSRAKAGKQSKPPNAGPELRLRIVLGKDIAIGPGKADLLEAIRETGSITAAGRAMQMSYKRAWYLLDSMNRCFAQPVVEATKGGKVGGGARLTRVGEELLRRYRRLERRCATHAATDLAALRQLMPEPDR